MLYSIMNKNVKSKLVKSFKELAFQFKKKISELRKHRLKDVQSYTSNNSKTETPFRSE